MERLVPTIFILAGIAAKPFRNIHWYRVLGLTACLASAGLMVAILMGFWNWLYL